MSLHFLYPVNNAIGSNNWEITQAYKKSVISLMKFFFRFFFLEFRESYHTHTRES